MSLRRHLALALLAVVVLVPAGCSRGSTGAGPTTTTTTTTTIRTGPPSVRVLGDGIASAAIAAMTAAVATSDVVDRSVAGSSPVSWLDISDRSVPDEGANHDAVVATVREAPSFVLVSLGGAAGSGAVDPLLRQRVMAVVFDVLARTTETKVLVIGSGAAPGSTAAAVDGIEAAAVAAVAESGASWADRVAFVPSPADLPTVLQQREWI